MMPRLAIAGLGLFAAGGASAADIVVCTPEHYYNSSETTPIVIPIDAARLAGSQITRLDIETGDYQQAVGAADGWIVAEGTMRIVNPGSMQERIDFVAVDVESGMLLRLSFVDADLPFVRVDDVGVASGHCEYAS